MPKRKVQAAPPFTRGEIHFIRDEHMTRYRVWQNNWNGQFDLLTYEEFAQVEAVAKRFNCIDLIDHTDED